MKNQTFPLQNENYVVVFASFRSATNGLSVFFWVRHGCKGETFAAYLIVEKGFSCKAVKSNYKT